jgi:hypothetical protein
MNKRSIARILGLSVVLWGAAVYAVNTKGAASCVPQVGLSHLLQKALFAPTPTCATTPGTVTCVSVGGSCNVPSTLSPGSAQSGTCTQTFAGCTCVPQTH